jgi:hypothetical protein
LTNMTMLYQGLPECYKTFYGRKLLLFIIS